ncbi:MAG: 30S ribosomal protein S2 [Candidatus Methanomethylicota archaeon]|uniref:Small ribosomal subunit protein uS2 n=1 Tax=Thermoproteota archaeon TaxID=2056631 RepID=A0A497F0N7_9CREN|nr:MAG: 30S ribosomal protein S2 [Candidatus Verstraetearchaeota archaeon]RLE52478.1 MAG: 30S ribosomal protein S2 [Candidatus Verstraetearchaeota archaeon]
MASEAVELLIPIEVYLAAGIHIGTHVKTKDMKPYIYRVRPDGLYVLDVRKTDEKIRIAAKMIARYPPNKVVAVSARQYGFRPVEKFCSLTGAIPVTGRFIPGTFTNPKLPTYLEPELLIVTDPRADRQAVLEAAEVGIPIIGFCDTDNRADFLDLIIPINNKGKKALALAYWILTRQVLRERGELAPTADLPVSLDEFESKLEEERAV